MTYFTPNVRAGSLSVVSILIVAKYDGLNTCFNNDLLNKYNVNINAIIEFNEQKTHKILYS